MSCCPDYYDSMKTASIRLFVDQADDTVQRIRWEADESGQPGQQEARAMILALWDHVARSSLRIDLWTHDMSIDDMNDFVFQTLLSLADTYGRATNNTTLVGEMKLFAQEFAEKASQFEQNRTQPRT